MRFHAEHRFNGSKEAVAALLADPAFYVGLALPDLSKPEVLEKRKDGDDAMLWLRYEFVGSLDPIGRRLLGSGHLAWIQEVRIDRSAGSGALRFEAEKDPRQLYGAADFVLAATGGGTVRRLDGELVVAVPGIGRMAERRIVPALLRRLDIEAQASTTSCGEEDELGTGGGLRLRHSSLPRARASRIAAGERGTHAAHPATRCVPTSPRNFGNTRSLEVVDR